MTSILITGGSGMLGKSLKKYFPNAKFLNGKRDLDLNKLSKVKLLNKRFDIIIHSAALTDLAYCDNNPEEAYNVHVNCVNFFQSISEKFIYISTNHNTSERIYYKTKRLGEEKTLSRKQDLVIRTNIFGNGGLLKWANENLSKNIKINGYSNVMFNPISVDQLSYFIHENLSNYNGILNTGSSAIISKYDFLQIFALIRNINLKLISPVETKGDLDLTIPLENQFSQFNLIEGILNLDI